jgi:glycine/D-amino acid oxidase-like deaminating enzyme/glycine cleavage system aminomethyltransferase T
VTTPPSRAQVVIIGGGAIGTSTAYHLTRMGITDVVLLEQGRLSGGTTWHAAGIVGQVRSSAAMTELARYSIDLYARLEEETGFATGWRQCGALWLARTEARLTHLQRTVSQARWFGTEGEIISPAEAKRRFPLVNEQDLVGAVWLPEDGTLNPTDLTQALARGATSRGAQVFEQTQATGIRVTGGRATGVQTAEGLIECETVVITGGQWSKAIADTIGVTVPLHPAQHFYVVTEQIDGIDMQTPIMRDPDGELYFKPEVGGLLVGSFERNALPWVRSADIPAPFEFRLIDENWDHFAPLLERAIERVPALGEVGFRKLYNGPESFTPDNNFILGESPEVLSLFVAAGFNSGGIANAGGAGVSLAEWIVTGEPQRDLRAVDISRFAPFARSDRWLAKRTIETLGDHYALPWPGREPETGRGIRRSPLYDVLKARGAWFGTKLGWERPAYYSPDGKSADYTFERPAWHASVEKEWRAARSTVALLDQTWLSKFLIVGADALEALQYVCAADVDVPIGGIVHSLALADDATLRADLVVVRFAETEFMVMSGTGQQVGDLAYLRRTVPRGLACSVVDVTSAYADLYVVGPRSRDLLQSVSYADLSREVFGLRTSRMIDIGETVVRVLRSSYAGGLGFELLVPTDEAMTLYETLAAAGTSYGLTVAGTYALEALRIERGRAVWGHELEPSVTPLETGMLATCKLDTGVDFRGREALDKAAATAAGETTLVRLSVADTTAQVWGGEVVLNGWTPVGTVTSAAVDYATGGVHVLAMVRATAAGSWTIDLGTRTVEATDASN